MYFWTKIRSLLSPIFFAGMEVVLRTKWNYDWSNLRKFTSKIYPYVVLRTKWNYVCSNLRKFPSKNMPICSLHSMAFSFHVVWEIHAVLYLRYSLQNDISKITWSQIIIETCLLHIFPFYFSPLHRVVYLSGLFYVIFSIPI